MKKEMETRGLDLGRLPFGRLTKESIQKAYRILSEIQKTLLTK